MSGNALEIAIEVLYLLTVTVTVTVVTYLEAGARANELAAIPSIYSLSTFIGYFHELQARSVTRFDLRKEDQILMSELSPSSARRSVQTVTSEHLPRE